MKKNIVNLSKKREEKYELAYHTKDIMRIYVAIPEIERKGGVESLHQLVCACNELGIKAYVHYFKPKGKKSNRPVLEEKEKIEIVDKIVDKSYNVLIVPEAYTYELRKYRYIKKCIWFLSLDYYLESFPIYKARGSLKKRNLPQILVPVTAVLMALVTNSSFRTIRLNKDKIPFYLYNCEYARNYIEKRCKYMHNSYYLCGPIDDVFFDTTRCVKKEKIVAYNPKKSTKYTEQVMSLLTKIRPDIDICPIKGLTTEQVKNLLERSSVYMDLGTFPGPERIPREAVMMKCNIITSRLGSAGDNSVDVPIRQEFKFDLIDENVEKICNLIIDMIDNYNRYTECFEKYRDKVIDQRERMLADVANIIKDIAEVQEM